MIIRWITCHDITGIVRYIVSPDGMAISLQAEASDCRKTRGGRNILGDPPHSPIEITDGVGFLNNSECVYLAGQERVHTIVLRYS